MREQRLQNGEKKSPSSHVENDGNASGMGWVLGGLKTQSNGGVTGVVWERAIISAVPASPT